MQKEAYKTDEYSSLNTNDNFYYFMTRSYDSIVSHKPLSLIVTIKTIDNQLKTYHLYIKISEKPVKRKANTSHKVDQVWFNESSIISLTKPDNNIKKNHLKLSINNDVNDHKKLGFLFYIETQGSTKSKDSSESKPLKQLKQTYMLLKRNYIYKVHTSKDQHIINICLLSKKTGILNLPFWSGSLGISYDNLSYDPSLTEIIQAPYTFKPFWKDTSKGINATINIISDDNNSTIKNAYLAQESIDFHSLLIKNLVENLSNKSLPIQQAIQSNTTFLKNHQIPADHHIDAEDKMEINDDNPNTTLPITTTNEYTFTDIQHIKLEKLKLADYHSEEFSTKMQLVEDNQNVSSIIHTTTAPELNVTMKRDRQLSNLFKTVEDPRLVHSLVDAINNEQKKPRMSSFDIIHPNVEQESWTNFLTHQKSDDQMDIDMKDVD